MKGYLVKPTRVTPSVYFNPAKGLLDIRGRSCPENPLLFYNPLLESIDRFAEEPYEFLRINFAFEYFNTSSCKCLFVLLKKLNKLKTGRKIIINWFFEVDDEDMLETGEDLSDFFSLTFNFVEIVEIKLPVNRYGHERYVA